MKRLTTIRTLFFTMLLFGVIVVGCNREKFLGDTSPSLSANDYKISLKYDAEYTVTQKVVNPSDDAKLKPSDRIGAIPFVHRVEVQMGIKADGTSDWVISKREPKNPLKTVRTALPDPTPKAAVMKFKDNRLTTYDKNGKLLKSHDIDLNSMTKRFLEVLYPDPSLATLRSARTIQDIVAEARDQGATVTTTDNVKFCIRKDDPREGRYTITYLDGAIGKAVGSSIHKTNGDFIYSNNVMFKPNPNQANDYVVENMVERNFSTSSASGVAIVTEKITHFTSFQYTGN